MGQKVNMFIAAITMSAANQLS